MPKLRKASGLCVVDNGIGIWEIALQIFKQSRRLHDGRIGNRLMIGADNTGHTNTDSQNRIWIGPALFYYAVYQTPKLLIILTVILKMQPGSNGIEYLTQQVDQYPTDVISCYVKPNGCLSIHIAGNPLGLSSTGRIKTPIFIN